MVTLKTLDKTSEEKEDAKIEKEGSGRASIDLVCVIDNSGSMEGEKIENVKKTLVSLLDLMGEDDRICLILFNSDATRLCHLQKTNKNNRDRLLLHIN